MKTRMREEATERDGHGGCRPSAAGGRGSGGVSKEERELLLLSRGWCRCSTTSRSGAVGALWLLRVERRSNNVKRLLGTLEFIGGTIN